MSNKDNIEAPFCDLGMKDLYPVILGFEFCFGYSLMRNS